MMPCRAGEEALSVSGDDHLMFGREFGWPEGVDDSDFQT
jgi:hypothetical protein